MDKTTTIIFIIIIILVIAGIAYGVYVYFAPTAVAPEAQNQQSVNQIAGQEDPYAGWKTYVNEEYGFSFKYPGDWNVEFSEGKDLDLKKYFSLKIKKLGVQDEIELKSKNFIDNIQYPFVTFYSPVFMITGNKTTEINIEQYVQKQCEGAMQGIGACSEVGAKTKIAGVDALNMIHCVEAANSQGFAFINNGYVFSVTTPYLCMNDDYKAKYSDVVSQFNQLDSQYRSIYNQILSTFKFTK